jgi:hypothetical protein
VAADASTDFAPPRARLLAAVRVTPAQAVALVFAASVIGRGFAGWLRATPIYFPDEYIYSEVGRSLAAHGRPLVRGVSAHFPALLQPLVTAPAWLFDDIDLSFRLIQFEGALVMSAAAFVAYRLAGRLGLDPWIAVAIAAFTVAGPDLLYAGWVLADPFAYPLALAAIGAAVAALSRPARKSQLAFLALAGLTTFTRIQFVILPVCFVGAILVIGLRERRLRSAFSEQRLVLSLLGLSVLGSLLAGPNRLLGYYDGVLANDFHPWPILKWFGTDAMLLLYSSGWVLIPGALLGLVLVFHRPRSRAELAFAAFTPLFTVALLLEAAFYGANGADRIQERYFFYVLPLVALLFGLYAARGFPLRRHHAVLAAALVLVSVRVPLSGFSAAQGKMNSPFLLAMGELEYLIGEVGVASLVVALTALVLSAATIFVIHRLRSASLVLVGVAVVMSSLASAAAITFEHAASRGVYDSLLWPSPSFVDEAGLENVAVLESPLADRGFTTEELFWNRSLGRVLLLPYASPPDAFAASPVQIARDGSLTADGEPVEAPLLLDNYGATIELGGTTPVARNRIFQLVRPAGRPRMALYVPGRYYDGWLGLAGRFRLWPADGEGLAGRLRFELSLPNDLDAATVSLTLPGGEKRRVHVDPGSTVPVSLPVCSSGPWSADFEGPLRAQPAKRLVSVRATRPAFTPDPRAC